MKKRIFKGMAAAAMIASLQLMPIPVQQNLSVAYAQSNSIQVIIDGKSLEMDQPPIVVDGRTLVPMRAIFEALDFKVSWQEENQQITAIRRRTGVDSTNLFIKADEGRLVMDYVEYLPEGDRFVTFNVFMDVMPQTVSGRILVPTRAVSEALGCEVGWDGVNRIVTIDTSNAVVVMSANHVPYGSQEMAEQPSNPVPSTPEPEVVVDSTQTQWKTPVPLTSPPEVGSRLAKIVVDDASITGVNRFTEPYRIASTGQCTWYAEGRFFEIYGQWMPLDIGSAKKWLENASKYDYLTVITDMSQTPELSIAVFKNTANDNHPGHVVFIEYVERDDNGNPLYIYYSEANGPNSDGNDYNPKYDGIIQKETFDDFKKSYNQELLGYIVPNLEK